VARSTWPCAVHAQRRLDDHFEAVLLPERLQQRDIAGALLAEAKVRPDHPRPRAPIAQSAQELVGWQARELGREGLHDHVIGAGGDQQFAPSFDRGERHRAAVRRHDRRGVRMKCQRDRREPVRVRVRARGTHQRLMPQMYAVVIAWRDDSGDAHERESARCGPRLLLRRVPEVVRGIAEWLVDLDATRQASLRTVERSP
jgi:hypothetical protein